MPLECAHSVPDVAIELTSIPAAPSVSHLAVCVANDNFALLGVNVDRAFKFDEIESMLSELDIDWEQIYEGSEEYVSIVTEASKVSAYPAVFLLDPQGIARYREFGVLDSGRKRDRERSRLVRRIQKLLGRSALAAS